MCIAVRCAAVTDLDGLARINVNAWQSAYRGLVPQAHLDAMSLDALSRRWHDNLVKRAPSEIWLVADVAGHLAGYCIGGPYRPQDNHDNQDPAKVGELYAIYIDPSQQRKGAGSSLQDRMLEWLQGQGYAEAALWVLRDNTAAIKWYADRGWRRDGGTNQWATMDTTIPEVRLRRPL